MEAMRRLAGMGRDDDRAEGPPADRRPICVDLDGALLHTDPLYETLVVLGKQRPCLMLQLPRWLLRGGGAGLRAELARHACLSCDTLPLDEDLLARLRAAHAQGRALALFSSLDEALVEGIARRLQIFQIARGNLAGRRKLEAMREACGGDFIYIGPGGRDLPAPPAEAGAAGGGGQAAVAVADPIGGPPPSSATRSLKLWAKALRLHQWAKNALIFAPIVLAGPLASVEDLVEGAFAFLAFGLLASAGYLVNDLLDLEADRRHAIKQNRPFAAGALSIRTGLLAIPGMVLTAAAVCALMPAPFAAVAGAYLVLTVAYSLRLKEQPLLDVIVLAGLFTIRVLAGAVLLSKPVSYWLLTFAMFLFLSLALIKRCAELQAAGAGVLAHRGGYASADLTLLTPLGLAAAVAANVIFVIYLLKEHFPSQVYHRPEWLWLIFPILLWWVLRLWRITIHGGMHEDPVLFALHDRTSLAVGAAVLALLALAWW